MTSEKDQNNVQWVYCVSNGCEDVSNCYCHVTRHCEDPPNTLRSEISKPSMSNSP